MKTTYESFCCFYKVHSQASGTTVAPSVVSVPPAKSERGTERQKMDENLLGVCVCVTIDVSTNVSKRLLHFRADAVCARTILPK